MQPHPRAGHRSPPLTAERGCPGHKTDSHPHSQCHGEHRWTPGGRGLAQTTGPPWRTIFRFSGDYASLLPKTAFRKAAGQAGRASSGETPPSPQLPRLCKLPERIVPGTMVPAPSKTRASPLATEFSRAPSPGQHLGSWVWSLGGQMGGHCLKWQSPRLWATRNS